VTTILKKNTRRGQAETRAESEAAKRRFDRRRSWFSMELTRQTANRFQMALDEDYYDSEQWTADEAAEVRGRGQNPVVHNEVAPMVDFVLGTERRMRVDHQVTHRFDSSAEAQEDAQAKTQILKLIDDVNRTQFVRSDCADDQYKGGLGWLEIGVKKEPSQFAIYKRKESWRNMLHDSLGQHKMPEDWRYLFRFREVDFDIAEAMVPRNKVDALRRAVITADTRRYIDWHNGSPMTGQATLTDVAMTSKWTTYDAEAWLANPRERVMLIEAWMTEVYRDTGDASSGMEDATGSLRKRVAIMTEYDTLIESWSPYAHDRYPFVPFWCYRRKKDGAPYGLIRRHRGNQDSINKHMSKAQFRLGVRQIWLESGALDPKVMDVDELEEKAADPSAVLEFAKGALSGGKVQLQDGTQLAQADIMMAEQFARGIRQLGPVSTEDRGQDPNGGISGKARAIRQEQGSRLTAEVFDNSMLARQLEGEITLSLAEQYLDQPMEFQAANDGGKREYVKINQPGPDGTKINDITARKAQYVIGETPWQQSLAESAFESMMSMIGELAKVAPAVVTSLLDVLFDLHPALPRKQVILQRIRQVTGMPDPAKGETPEMQAKQQQQAAMAQAQFEAQMAQLKADIVEAQNKGIKLSAEAMAKRLETLYMAAQAAQVLTAAPQIAPVADELARSVGFQDESGDGALNAPVPTVNAPAIPAAQQADGALQGAQAGIQSPEVTGIQPQGGQ
jgi:hypothetical protein